MADQPVVSVIDLGRMVHELLSGFSTVIEAIRTSYESTIKLKDTVTARRDIKQLERISEEFAKLVFEPHGIRELLRQYVNEPKSRGVKSSLESMLNSSQDLYNEALRSLNLRTAFKARHPELMDQLGTVHKQKGRIISGIGNRTEWHGTDAELAQLRALEPLFDEVNTGIEQIRAQIKTVLVEFDRQDRSR